MSVCVCLHKKCHFFYTYTNINTYTTHTLEIHRLLIQKVTELSFTTHLVT